MSGQEGTIRRLAQVTALTIGMLSVWLVASCSSGGEPGIGSEQESSSTIDASGADEAASDGSDTDTGTEADTGTDHPSWSEPIEDPTAPLVFFGAVPPLPAGSDLPVPDGSEDYHQLFAPDSGWPTATERISAFKLHAWQVRHVIDDDQLAAIIDWLDTNDVPLMFETEPLPPPDPEVCDHTESFEGPYDLEMARRIEEFGGTIAVVAIEQPFHYAHLLTGPGACQYPIERVVDEVIDYVEQMREIFPDVPVGTIEAIWQTPRTEPDDLALWLDTYEERSGEPFAFLHLDPDWSREDWAETARGIEDVAEARGVPFGLLYNGGQETDGSAWLEATMDRIAHYQTSVGGTPDHVGLQSWVDQPDRVLPENDLGAFTSLINRYFGQPTALTADQRADNVVFQLTDASGAPIADQPISIELRPLSGAGQTHTVTATVPDAARTAVIAIRVHTEDAATGQTDVTLDEVSYTEDGQDTNRVANPDFAAGLRGWGAYGEPLGQVGVEGSEPMLRLRANEEQLIMIDSDPFDVTAGSDFRFEARLSVPAESVGNATVAVVFLADSEVTRHSITFAPIEVEAAPVRTDGSGTAILSADVLGSASVELEARYAGDLDRWPATASTTVDVDGTG